jgi:hypothetical protein
VEKNVEVLRIEVEDKISKLKEGDKEMMMKLKDT